MPWTYTCRSCGDIIEIDTTDIIEVERVDKSLLERLLSLAVDNGLKHLCLECFVVDKITKEISKLKRQGKWKG